MAAPKSATRRYSAPFASWAYVAHDFARAWLSYFVMAVIIAGVTHGVFHIPLWQVVDVMLALMLFFVAFVASLTVITMCLDLAGREFMVALARVIGLVLLIFLPFGAILGFMAYGFFAETEFESSSFVYKGFVALFANGYAIVSGVTGDFLGVIRTTGSAVAATPMLDQSRLLTFAQIASAALAAFGYAMSRSRVTLLADDTLRYSPFALLRR